MKKYFVCKDPEDRLVVVQQDERVKLPGQLCEAPVGYLREGAPYPVESLDVAEREDGVITARVVVAKLHKYEADLEKAKDDEKLARKLKAESKVQRVNRIKELLKDEQNELLKLLAEHVLDL